MSTPTPEGPTPPPAPASKPVLPAAPKLSITAKPAAPAGPVLPQAPAKTVARPAPAAAPTPTNIGGIARPPTNIGGIARPPAIGSQPTAARAPTTATVARPVTSAALADEDDQVPGWAGGIAIIACVASLVVCAIVGVQLAPTF